MITLTIVTEPGYGNEFAAITATVTTRTGREVLLCNPFAELQEAIEAGHPFIAHEVIGMKPRAVIINPAHVALVEVLR